MNRIRPRTQASQPYLKLINQRSHLPFKIEESYPLGDLTTIGRSPGNDIVLRDGYISGEHAQIRQGDENYFLEDLGSTNGTFINGVRIKEPVILKNGDRISFRQVDFLFVLDQK
jgi:pSer/pThr/pTyr-binding forkhead associated (FHA) protein